MATQRLFLMARDMSWSGASFISALEHLCQSYPKAEDFVAASLLVEVGVRMRTKGVFRMLDESNVNDHLDMYGQEDFDFGDMQPEDEDVGDTASTSDTPPCTSLAH